MIKHVVMWKFKDIAEGRGRHENLQQARDMLMGLADKIPEIRTLEVGIDLVHSPQSYDLALIAEFDSAADLEMYRDHAEHQRVVRFLRTVHAGRVVVDYEGGS
jgi:hypothetical protein